jgi:2-polyprenyl-3-methyl-5-hydroxy-6-metoxy-1,4-benzoquinol methylase
MVFSAHNIKLPDGTETMPGFPLWKDGSRCQQLIRKINNKYPIYKRAQIKILELGCLEGGNAVALAEEGYHVVGVELRDENIDKLDWLHSKMNDKLRHHLRFEQIGLPEIPRSWGTFDLVYCGGLIVDVSDPDLIIRNLSRLAKDIIVITTNIKANTERISQTAISDRLNANGPKKKMCFEDDFEIFDLAKVNLNLQGISKTTHLANLILTITKESIGRVSIRMTKDELTKFIFKCGYPMASEKFKFIPYEKMVKFNFGLLIGKPENGQVTLACIRITSSSKDLCTLKYRRIYRKRKSEFRIFHPNGAPAEMALATG